MSIVTSIKAWLAKRRQRQLEEYAEAQEIAAWRTSTGAKGATPTGTLIDYAGDEKRP